MKIVIWEKSDASTLLQRMTMETQTSVSDSVRAVINTVRTQGDRAVRAYTEQWDGVSIENLEVSFRDATVDSKTAKAIEHACENITRFHEAQFPKTIALTVDGNQLRREYRAIERVGLYVPSGTAPLISTISMLAIPARIAGCRERIVVTPPRRDGSVDPAMLYAARICGVTQMFRCGGTQAIAALAYGTETIPKVMKVFGPGNKYVTEAKQQVSQDPAGCARDMPAGPSEVMVIADASSDPRFVAADLLSQAEHDVDSKAVLVTNDAAFAERVRDAVNTQMATLSRQSILKESVASMLGIVAKDITTCIEIANRYAPEHLILQMREPNQYVPLIQNAGSVFIGPWAGEALGDYASGTNHVLPTYGYARTESGLVVESFMKSITFQEVTPEGLLALAPTVEQLATLEGLDAHREAVVLRRLAVMEKQACVE